MSPSLLCTMHQGYGGGWCGAGASTEGSDVADVANQEALPGSAGRSASITSSLEPASYITQNSSSKLLIPLSATFIWARRSNLLHTAITFHHFFTVSLLSSKLRIPFLKILGLSSTLIII